MRTSQEIYEYWNKREEPTGANDQYTHHDIDFVKKHLDGCKTILDYGAGIGRLFPAYNGIGKVTTLDISTSYFEKILIEAKKFEFEFEHHMLLQDSFMEEFIIEKFFQPNEFDAIVAVQLFMVISPNFISFLMNQLASFGRKVIATSWYERDKPINIVDHDDFIWQHDYPKLLGQLNLEVFDMQFYHQHMAFMYSKKEKEKKKRKKGEAK